MRVERLDLTRYGKFTDRTLDFGVADPGACDLHIVYGPNEAGKSTILAAFLDFLFGIGVQSRYNFLHPYATMRIGGRLALDSGPHELVRVKRPRNSLLDKADQPVAEGLLIGQLGGLDREAYRAMFSLDDETLEAGGESLLASKGDIGQILFSATAGLADLSRNLGGLRTEADSFYKYRAHGGLLASLKADLQKLRDDRERVDMVAADYGQLIDARDRAAALYEQTLAERGAIQARRDAVQRHLAALPRLAALRGLRHNLTPIADLPDPPAGWRDALPGLQTDAIELAVRMEGIEREIGQVAADSQALVLDAPALRLADRVADLADARARAMTAAKDIPERRLQWREARSDIAGLLSRLERDGDADPNRLLLGATSVGVLRDLIETRSGVMAAVEAATAEVAVARARLDEATASLEAIGGTLVRGRAREGCIATLAALVAALRLDDHQTRRRLAARARTAHREALSESLRDLRPWVGDGDQLAALAVPEADDRDRWRAATAAIRQDVQLCDREIARLAAEASRLRTDLDASVVAGLVGDTDAAAIRAVREAAWADHRRVLDPASAAAFEAALRHDDLVTNGRFGHATALAKRLRNSQALAALETDLVQATTRRAACDSALAQVQNEIAAALRAMNPPLPHDTTGARLDVWLSRRDKALDAFRHLRTAERDWQEAGDDADVALQRLASALAAVDSPAAADAQLDAMLVGAQTILDAEADIRALRRSAEASSDSLDGREQDLAKADRAAAAWTAAWTEACSSCWIGERGVVPAPGTVRAILEAVAELGPALNKAAGLEDRIRKMTEDRDAYESEVAAIATALDIEIVAGPGLDHARQIDERVRQARRVAADRAALLVALDQARERRTHLLEAVSLHTARQAEMIAFFGVATLADVAAAMRNCERKVDLERQAATTEQDILDLLRIATIADAERVLDTADRAALETECGDLTLRFEDHDRRTRDLFASHAKAVDRVDAIGGDAAVAAIEERRRTILLEIEDGALHYLKLRIGIVAADQALRSYRDRHRSSMLAHASECFRAISKGIYSGLTTQPHKDGETLIAVGADGGSKIASDLSKGTRFQLYLALRMAGYHEFARSHRAVPFIADDIMETFDDFRAEETFRLLADMATVGQVVYLTHHRHLLEIARRVCPSARVHDVSAAVAV